MSILETYKTNCSLREHYFRVNGITHAEICAATDCCNHIDPDAYKIMLGDGDGKGWWEPREFDTIGQARAWCATCAPELVIA